MRNPLCFKASDFTGREGQPLSWGNLPADDGGALRKPSRLACLQALLIRVTHAVGPGRGFSHTLPSSLLSVQEQGQPRTDPLV